MAEKERLQEQCWEEEKSQLTVKYDKEIFFLLLLLLLPPPASPPFSFTFFLSSFLLCVCVCMLCVCVCAYVHVCMCICVCLSVCICGFLRGGSMMPNVAKSSMLFFVFVFEGSLKFGLQRFSKTFTVDFPHDNFSR